MTNVIILHGKPDKWEFYDENVPIPSEDHWYSWIQKQLLIRDIIAVKPCVLRSFEAKYTDWVKEIEKTYIDSETILVGHSAGGGFFLRWLSENPQMRIKKLILVAPWLDPLAFMKENFGHDLYDFEPDKDLLSRIGETIVFHSKTDMESIVKSLERIKEYWPDIEVREFEDYGHFCKQSMTKSQFPELLEEILTSV